MQHKQFNEKLALSQGQQESVTNSKPKRPFVANNAGQAEWYSPTPIVEAARAVMGSIDLDPASTEIANRVVKATTYYTAEVNGLDKPWQGNVFLNPPYASKLVALFSNKLLSELGNVKQAVVLVNNGTETKWQQGLMSRASAICFPKGRVKFYAPDGRIAAPLQGQSIFYFGDKTDAFTKAFKGIGRCVVPVGDDE